MPPTSPADLAEGLAVSAFAGYLGTATGAAMSLIAAGLGHPRGGLLRAEPGLPLATHLRGLAAHLAFGLAVVAVTESAWCLRRQRP